MFEQDAPTNQNQVVPNLSGLLHTCIVTPANRKPSDNLMNTCKIQKAKQTDKQTGLADLRHLLREQ
jgi:hypothetical protein